MKQKENLECLNKSFPIYFSTCQKYRWHKFFAIVYFGNPVTSQLYVHQEVPASDFHLQVLGQTRCLMANC